MPRSEKSSWRLVWVVLLCAPSILGVVGLWFIQAGLSESGRPIALGSTILFAMSLFGPLLLVPAAWLLITGWRGRKTDPAAMAAWATLALAIASTAAFHSNLIWSVPLP